jgi:hypothetical protein
MASNVLDLLIQDEAKSLGRKRKYDEYKASSDNKEIKLQKIQAMLGISSANLAGASLYTLDRDITEVLRVKDNEELRKKTVATNRKEVIDTKARERFLTAALKYKDSKSLNATDMKALLRKVTEPNDSPIKTKITELSQQYHRRQHRVQELFSILLVDGREAENTPPVFMRVNTGTQPSTTTSTSCLGVTSIINGDTGTTNSTNLTASI